MSRGYDKIAEKMRSTAINAFVNGASLDTYQKLYFKAVTGKNVAQFIKDARTKDNVPAVPDGPTQGSVAENKATQTGGTGTGDTPSNNPTGPTNDTGTFKPDTPTPTPTPDPVVDIPSSEELVSQA